MSANYRDGGGDFKMGEGGCYIFVVDMSIFIEFGSSVIQFGNRGGVYGPVCVHP